MLILRILCLTGHVIGVFFETVMNLLNPDGYHILQWLFPLAITFHNLEEGILLPRWKADAGRWNRFIDRGGFRIAVVVLTILAYLVTYWSIVKGPQSIALYVYCGYCWAMLINAIVPHVVATIALRKYVPGFATAVLLVIPATVVILWKSLEYGYISILKLLLISVPVIVGLLVLIRILFRIASFKK